MACLLDLAIIYESYTQSRYISMQLIVLSCYTSNIFIEFYLLRIYNSSALNNVYEYFIYVGSNILTIHVYIAGACFSLARRLPIVFGG